MEDQINRSHRAIQFVAGVAAFTLAATGNVPYVADGLGEASAAAAAPATSFGGVEVNGPSCTVDRYGVNVAETGSGAVTIIATSPDGQEVGRVSLFGTGDTGLVKTPGIPEDGTVDLTAKSLTVPPQTLGQTSFTMDCLPNTVPTSSTTSTSTTGVPNATTSTTLNGGDRQTNDGSTTTTLGLTAPDTSKANPETKILSGQPDTATTDETTVPTAAPATASKSKGLIALTGFISSFGFGIR